MPCHETPNGNLQPIVFDPWRVYGLSDRLRNRVCLAQLNFGSAALATHLQAQDGGYVSSVKAT